MSDEEEYDSDKTQIFLPGGRTPKAPKPADDDNQGVLLKAGASAKPAAGAKETTSVDFDITSGAGLGDGGEAAGNDDAKARAAAAATAARAQKQVADSSASSGASFGTIIVVVIVAAIAYFLLR